MKWLFGDRAQGVSVAAPRTAPRRNTRPGAALVERVSRRHLIMLLALAAIWGSSFMFTRSRCATSTPSTLILFRIGVRRARARPSRAARGPALRLAAPVRLAARAARAREHGRAVLPDRVGPAAHRLRPRRDPERLRAALHRALRRLDRPHPARHRAAARRRRASASSAWCCSSASSSAAADRGRRRARRRGRLGLLRRSPASTPAAASAGSRRRSSPSGRSIWATLFALPRRRRRRRACPAGRRSCPCSFSASLRPALAYLLYFGLIAGAGASRAILVTYLVPALALVYGAVFLDEPLTALSLVGLALVLAGVALGTGTVRR